MRQRLALERALLHEPRLVLMDEPFTGLDDAAIATRRATRLRAWPPTGAIVVLATHDLDLADGLVTRVAVVRGGRLRHGRTRRRRPARALSSAGGATDVFLKTSRCSS